MERKIILRREAKSANLPRYFTGKPCPKGHIAERYTKHGTCCQCASENAKSQAKKEYDRRYYRENKERIGVRVAKYAEENKEAVLARVNAWSAENPERVTANKLAYKHRRRSWESGGLSGAEQKRWEREQKKVCYWCGDGCAKKYEVDHYIPLSKGGAHEEGNLVISCPSCNRLKSSKDPYKFAAQVGRLF